MAATAKGHAIDFYMQDLKFFDFNFDRLQHHFLFLARKFVRGHALNLFGRERRRHLLNHSPELSSHVSHSLWLEAYRLNLCGGFAFGVVGVGGESEADRAFVGLLRRRIKLRQTSQAPGDQRQDTGGKRIERPRVPYPRGAERSQRSAAREFAVRG